MTKPKTELLKGTLDMLILRTLDLEPRHGLGVADRIEQITQGTFRVKPGSLFPALHRLEQEGFIEGRWDRSPEGRRGKYLPADASGTPAAGRRAPHLGAHRPGGGTGARSRVGGRP